MTSNNLLILKLLLRHPQKNFSVKEISRELGLSRTGTYWVMADLNFQGFVSVINDRPARYKINEDLFSIS